MQDIMNHEFQELKNPFSAQRFQILDVTSVIKEN